MNRMQQILKRLCEGDILSRFESSETLRFIAAGEVPENHVVAFLTAFAMRLATVEELIGFRSAMLELATPIRLERSDAIDVCGTGGDGKETFNISTVCAFIVAGAGVPVVKHGNHGFSSRCGSSTVLEALGLTFPTTQDEVNRDIDRAGIAFLHAPLFHPAMRSLAGLRRQLGLRTVFNVLGPMSNPARPARQVVGVCDPALLTLVCDVLIASGVSAHVIHGVDGYDEVSLTSDCLVQRPTGEQRVAPRDFGVDPVDAEELHGGATTEEAATIVRTILRGQGTRAQNDAALANAAIALSAARPELSLLDAMNHAREALLAGKALRALHQLGGA